MADNEQTVKIEIVETGNGISAAIKTLPAVLPDGSPVSKEAVMQVVRKLGISHGLDEEAIEFYVSEALRTGNSLSKALIAHAQMPERKDEERLDFSIKVPYKLDEMVKWGMLYQYHKNADLEVSLDPPVTPIYIHAGTEIARKREFTADKMGINIFGEELHPIKVTPVEWMPGDNVTMNEGRDRFIAMTGGFLSMHDNIISIHSPFFITKDKMKLYFLNLPRVNEEEYPNEEDLKTYTDKNKIPYHSLRKVKWEECEIGTHPLIAEGKRPGKSKDAEIQLFFSLEESIGKMDDLGRIDYRERDLFKSIEEGTLLATKKLPIKGTAGLDVFLNVVHPPAPKDLLLNHGPGIRLEKSETDIKYFCAADGILEYKNNQVAVNPTILIRGDVDLETGHIDSNANVQIMGSVLAGFRVKSAKNILINGTVEDNCLIEARGDIQVKGGVTGESTRVICGGAFVAKYVEACRMVVQGRMTIQRFIRGADVECHEHIIVFGSSINLNERGAIVDAVIRVRKSLLVPAVGSDAGLKTIVYFGYDRQLQQKIDQLQETLAKLKENIADLKAGFDMGGPPKGALVKFMQMKINRSKRMELIRKEIENLEKKRKMMKRILVQELEKKNEMLAETSVEIQKKVFPDMILFCNDVQKTVDREEGSSKYYYDPKSRMIERCPIAKSKL